MTTCSQLPQAVAVSRLKQAWEACKVNGSTRSGVLVGNTVMPLLSTTGMSVGVEDSSEKTALVLRANNGSVMAVADFKTGSDGRCKTVVTTRGSNPSWIGFAEKTPQWLNDPTGTRAGCSN